MTLIKKTNIGNIKIELPINIGDIVISGNSKYPINRFIVLEEAIYAINSHVGLWFNIEQLEFIKKIDNKNYYVLHN